MDTFFSFENLEKFCEKNPDSLAFAYLAARHLELKQYNDALNICEEGLEKHPDYAFGHYIYALAHYYLRNLDKSKDELEVSLSHEPGNPQAWKILGSIDEDLNLPILTKESNLKYFLCDYFNTEAAERYLKSDIVTIIPSDEELVPDKTLTEDTEKAKEVVNEEEINQLFEINEDISGDEFDQAMDEVFKYTGGDIEEETKDTNLEAEAPGGPKKFDSIKKNELETQDDDFSEAMDSFFKDYEDEDNISIDDSGVKNSEEKQQHDINLDTDEGPGDEKVETEEFESDIDDFQKSEEDQIGGEDPDKTEKIDKELQDVFGDEEPMDFSAVVADIISERGDEGDEEAIESIENETDSNTERVVSEIFSEEFEEDDGTQMEQPTSETVEKVKQEEVNDIPAQSEIGDEKIKSPISDELEKRKPTEETSEKVTTTPERIKDNTTHFGRPPILSPTLGEIYISQGRFEEAIDVFRQLLDKDPENSRYERKIHDLEEVLRKQKSSEN